MKVCHLSDIHVDVNNRGKAITPRLVAYLNTLDYDVLMITGDLAGSMDKALAIVAWIEAETGRKVLFVPGNHDLAADPEERDGDESYAMYEESDYNLVGNPYYVNEEWAIVGGMSWYDYTFCKTGHTFLDLEKAKDAYWRFDASYVPFALRDRDVFELMLSRLEMDIETAIATGRKVWVANHFVPYEDYVVYMDGYGEGESVWNMCNAYMGSERLGQLFDSYDGVKVVSFGHTHKRFPLHERNGKLMICQPLGYRGREWRTTRFEREIKMVAPIVDLNDLERSMYE